ncbi:MAG TPA: bifunctional aspartate transaminase/aspartate 4-decarboxylase [Stackebrandtia sp.]|jgi:aspartate 4-decarboxylase|uniref:bifunctional aspartate transaminase/aspartate 4-decarboxylase n=1 Tax=Stackebrandtia sp. TaxID=2023065 RepID=UPI002D415935|nr:bifunctional aspartate transaminase/aspartate 4-decarboxylase [Stackebrandtia sp.]HZE38042.1 bifunctional aspartate transaminase/aspartate 4-decarboxylase [Stackebrandtia sp.]
MTMMESGRQHTNRDSERRLESLSPFELKNTLISLADDQQKRTAMQMVNAGRGNPNWIAATPRDAFFLLGRFGMEEARRDWSEWDDLAGMPQESGIAGRLDAFLSDNASDPGADLLRRGVAYGVDELGFDADAWVHELADSIIGDQYPVPDRMLTHVEKVVHQYLVQEMCGGRAPAADYDLFATEGGTAAMCYIFDSAIINRLLHKGDKIAIMTPIFTPYLEIPHLERYQFDVMELKAERTNAEGFHTWQFPDSEINKLADPDVKALFCVHPSNPPSVMMDPSTMDRIVSIVNDKNPELTIITDDVYGTFVNGFRSLMGALPRNTIGVYSFSKYFGCTGWRLGVIAVNQVNVFDERLATLPASDKKILNERYGTLTLEPEKMRFIDRMVADSRQVALNHTAGLSLPQQTQMALFALHCLLDTDGEYKQICQSIIARRMKALTKGLGVELPSDPLAAHYYVELDLLSWAERHWGAEFAAWMRDHYEPVDAIFRLAEQDSVVLLNGGGFDGPEWSVRISLANLPMAAYERIGKALWDIGQEYKREFDARER